MADYAGIGRLNMFLYVMVFVICMGITVAIFAPGSTYGSVVTDTSALSDTKSAPSGNDIFGFFGFIWGLLVAFFTFIGRALIVDIPFVPAVVRLCIGFPMTVLFFVLVIDYAVEFVKTVSSFLSSLKII